MTFRQFVYRNVIRNKRIYAAYFLSSAFSVMIFFVCALFIFNPDVRNGLFYDIVLQAMGAAESIMYVFSFFFVLYSVSSFLRSRKREFGVLLMHGMTKRQLNVMVFLENMLIGIGAIIAGMVAGLLTGKLFLMIGSSFLGIPPLSFHVSWQAPALTIGSFALLFFIISICTSALIRTNRLIELFQAGQQPKAEPKASIRLSLLAAVLLLASYFLAATATAATVYTRMFPVIGMTVVGTYFFYTQLSVYIIKRLQRRRLFFWRNTNLMTLSSLSYRLKDNARMFFMVTIISTVSFCAVGVLTSINTLLTQYNDDYPAAVGYMAKEGSKDAKRHLEGIEAELDARGLNYEKLSFPIKYLHVDEVIGFRGKADADRSGRMKSVPLIPFSSYREAVIRAGHSFGERPLTGDQALVILGSLKDRPMLGTRGHLTYVSKAAGGKVQEIGITEHVPIPNHLLRELEEDFSGLVVSDSVFNRLDSQVKTDHYTGFYVPESGRTIGMAKNLAGEGGRTKYEADKSYAITVSGTLVSRQKGLYSSLLFVGLLVGTVFFIAAGSFLYFRLYADLDYDRRQYMTMAKVGLTDRELKRIVTRQLVLLFFVPIGVAMIHSVFAFTALQRFFYISIAADMGIVLISFFVAQVLYFYFIRNRYLRNLKKIFRHGHGIR
ncbi:FtsX-like permease family protein [Paenibacillus spongiae]|uniref:ABC transporter permease n=1 Tax=Paenibacillus spongiae TaxID=2909671 RepID=A0ABY5S9C3_9BACL|nr:ABC transporter permease [Paenibacillus spongiae]UVI30526.1 ABC transporter permease [Paenibacillus spongiae]